MLRWKERETHYTLSHKSRILMEPFCNGQNVSVRHFVEIFSTKLPVDRIKRRKKI